MKKRIMQILLQERRKLRRDMADLNTLVQVISEGKLHHQGCPLGGLNTGMVCDASGAPCWCGASHEPEQ